MDTQTLHLLRQSAQFFEQQGQQAHLVGGSLRNLLLGADCSDWDIVTGGDASALARDLAAVLGGHYVYLHARARRVVVPIPGAAGSRRDLILDIAPMQGQTLEEDLRRRDFSINALAAPLEQVVRYLATRQVLHPFDPLQGLADIEARRLRAVDDGIFRRDPLRLLRALRLRVRYQLSIDERTQDLLRRDADLLLQVAPERIQAELYAILELAGASEQLHWLDDFGLLTTLIPEFLPARGMPQAPPHYWDVLEHCLQAVGNIELLAALLRQPPQELRLSPLESDNPAANLRLIAQLVSEAEQQQIFSSATLLAPRMKLAALLHDIGKPATFTRDEARHIHFYGHPRAGVPLALRVMGRLNASAGDRRLVQQVTEHHMRPAQAGSLTARAIRRYFIDLGPQSIAVALFSLADHLATRGPLLNTAAGATGDTTMPPTWEEHLAAVCLLLTRYIRQREGILPPRLLSAEELMRRFNLRPGPELGLLLEHIAQAQVDGSVRTREEAIWLAEERLDRRQ